MSPLKSVSYTIKDSAEGDTVTQRCVVAVKGRTGADSTPHAICIRVFLSNKEGEKVPNWEAKW